MRQVRCYRVMLPAHGGLKDWAYIDGEPSETGPEASIYFMAVDARAVGNEFPKALRIEDLGIGYMEEKKP